MSKNILFVYSDILQKETLEQCEVILKAALKRFRKRADITYMQFDFSPLGFALSEKKLLSAIKNSDAVIWDTFEVPRESELNLAVKNLGVFAEVHKVGASTLLSPLSERQVSFDSDILAETNSLCKENLQKTAKLAVTFSKQQKKAITLCFDYENTLYGKILCREFEKALPLYGRIEMSELSYNEFLWKCASCVPDFPLLLTSEKDAEIVRLNLCALKKFPACYTIWHSDNLRIYKKESLPYEKMNNFPVAGLLIACAEAIDKELGYRNVGLHLKKCVALALEKYAFSPKEDFANEVLFLLNSRIRKKKEKKI